MFPIFVLVGIVAAGYAPQGYYNPPQYPAAQQQPYQNAPQQGAYQAQGPPQAGPPQQYPQTNGALTGYLLTPVPAPQEFIDTPDILPPSKAGVFTKIEGVKDKDVYIIEHHKPNGLPPGFSVAPHNEGEHPESLFISAANAPKQDGQPFTVVFVNGVHARGPSYNMLPADRK